MARFNVGPYQYVSPYDQSQMMADALAGQSFGVQGTPYRYAGPNPFQGIPTTPAAPAQPGAQEVAQGLYDGGAGSDPSGAANGPQGNVDVGLSPAQGLAVGLGMAAVNSGPVATAVNVGRQEMNPMANMSPHTQQAIAVSNMANTMGFSTPATQALGTVSENPSIAAAVAASDQAAASGGDAPGSPGGIGGPTGGSTGGQAASTSGGAPSSGNAGVGSGNDGAPGGADAGGDGCVVATALVNEGLFTPAQKREWLRYCIAEKHGRKIGEAQRIGYRSIFGPVAKKMRGNRSLSRVMRWIAAQYSEEITGRRRLKPVKWTLEPIAFAVGFFVGKR